jgi:S-adenosylmethionine:tRNA ribosyltransferase-isomerase
MKASAFDYDLPRERIAQRPLAERDASRMLLLDRHRHSWEDHRFLELPDLLRGDELIVVNNARVLPARLLGWRRGVSAQPVGRHSRLRRQFLSAPIEVLLTRQIGPDVWEALVRPGRKVRHGERIVFGRGEVEAEVVGRGEFGVRRLRFPRTEDLIATLERIGHMPLPPYIKRPDEPADRDRYQTIFARHGRAVAAPTAGLHFTREILARLGARGIELCEVTLEVGLGTFQPVRCEEIEDHPMHSEAYEIPEATAIRIERARSRGRAVLAVGTTVGRALEDAARKAAARTRAAVSHRSVRHTESGSSESEDSASPDLHRSLGLIQPGKAEADIFIYPGYTFRVVDQILTNFHLPRSSLLMMVSAFAGRELILRAYQHAIQQKYRFYSYGDSMLIR